MVRLKVVRELKLSEHGVGFDSKLVRLKALLLMYPIMIKAGFDSKMVRLKVRKMTRANFLMGVFRFQNGSIKS